MAENILPDDPSMAQVAKDINLSQVMVEGYLEWLAVEAADAGLTPVAVEEKVEVLLRPDVTLHGTIDLVMADPDGNLWLIDHKTAKDFSSLADRRLIMNFQLQTYALLCESFLGQAPAGAKLNILRKVLRTGTAKPPYFHREPVHFNQHQLAAFKGQLDAIIDDLLRAEADPERSCYPVVDGDCTWKCPFLSVCAMADDGSDINGALNDLYVRRDSR